MEEDMTQFDVHPARGFIFIILALAVGYAAAFAGDGAGILTFKRSSIDWWDADNIALLVVGVGAIGIILFGAAVVLLAKRMDRMHLLRPETYWVAMGTFVCCAFVFGYLATPFQSYGAAPWKWLSRFLLIPATGFIPLVFVIEETIASMFRRK